MRQRLARSLLDVLYFLGVWHLLLSVERWVGRRRHVIVLSYHHLRDPKDKEPRLSREAEGTKLVSFERHIRLLARWYEPASERDLESLLEGERPLDRDRFLVTFDDGYRDNRTLAGPILQRHAVPAVIFVATGFVDSKRTFWWLRLDEIVKGLPRQAWSEAVALVEGVAETPPGGPAALADFSSRRTARAWLMETLRNLASEPREALLDKLASLALPGAESPVPLLTWEEMRQMQRREGFSFGGHTHTHPNLAHLSADEIAVELRQCARILEEQLGVAPRAFAYPFGAYHQAGVQKVAHGGYRLAFTTRPGDVVPGQCSRYELPRFGLWRSGRGEIAATIVALKLLKYFPRAAAVLLARLLGEPLERVLQEPQGTKFAPEPSGDSRLQPNRPGAAAPNGSLRGVRCAGSYEEL